MEDFKITKCDFTLGLPVLNHHAASIDIGSMLMTVSMRKLRSTSL